MNYWRQQNTNQPLFPGLIWSKPEHKLQAGTLGILGGNKLGFLAVANAFQTASKLGIGEIKMVLPISLKKSLGNLPGTDFAPENPSGGLSKEAKINLKALAGEVNGLLCIGDAGKNTETQTLYENYFREISNDKPLIVTRDAVDLFENIMNEVVSRDSVTLVLSFSQLQKVFRSIYYPIMLVHSMQTSKLIEALHKFTLTYPATISVFHQDQFIAAKNGEVISTNFDRPTEIWQGNLPTKIACWTIWSPLKPLEACITALAND